MDTSPTANAQDAQLHRLIYVSKAAYPAFSVTDIDIMRAGMRNNPAVGVAGFLRRQGDNYIQVLEGPQQTLNQIIERIRRDRRHFDLKILCFEAIDSPRFLGWSMGYCSEFPPPFDPARLNDPMVDALAGEIVIWLARVAESHTLFKNLSDGNSFAPKNSQAA